jgi:hypothetical protein
LTDAIEPLTARRRNLVIALSAAVAVTRLFAVSHSMWDWDEALFCSALRHYDVASHHPHPPGFPLFFALANLARLVIRDDFHALRAISVISSFFVFPATFAVARSLRMHFRACVIAASLFAFLPNVWFWGGTAFSDMLALVTSLAGIALLLRDDEQRWTYIAGCVLFAATMLVRVQNVLLLWPWALATWRRVRSGRVHDAFAGTALIVVLVAIGYGIAAKLTGFEPYIQGVLWHQHYVATVDGSLNPSRIPMRYLLHDFAIDPFESRSASAAMALFAVVALLRPRRRHLDAALTFLPNFFLAWFLLNPTGISRLSLGYITLNALLAGDGIVVAGYFLARRARTAGRERVALALQALFAAVIIGRYVIWVRAGLHEVHTTDSPPVQAMRWIRANVPHGGKIYMARGLEPFTDYFLQRDYNVVPVDDGFDPTTAPLEANTYYAADRPSPVAQAMNFRRPRKRLWALFNRRYFEASVVPVGGWMKFAAGWYDAEEGADGDRWRWMGGESHTLLQPFGCRAALGVTFTLPLDAEPAPVVTIALDGRVIDRFVPRAADVERTYLVPSRSATSDELVLSVDHVMNPARLHHGDDSRDLGLQLHRLVWKAAP